jgi:allophanate hydrolase
VEPDLSLISLKASFDAGLRPSDLMVEIDSRCRRHPDPAIWIHRIDLDGLLCRADELERGDPSLPLYGMPFATKDNIDVAGLPTTCACPDFA